MFGFCVKQMKVRIKKSHRNFHNGFICLECDVWTSQSKLSVLSVDVTFHGVTEKKAVTIVLSVVPLMKGKRATKLRSLMKKILESFGTQLMYIRSAVGDGKNA